jgi:DNA-binding response OmpR family regulator
MSALPQSRNDTEALATRIALVADDDLDQRILLKALLSGMGYRVLLAGDGTEAVRLFEQAGADLVCMNAVMPTLDGFHAAARIKQLAGERCVPILFCTAPGKTGELARCFDAGGDDVISKPYDLRLLRARLAALEHMRTRHETAGANNAQLVTLHAQRDQDERAARRVFDRAIDECHRPLPELVSLYLPAERFSGDVLLSHPAPGGGWYLLVGDFTGHGIGAAIGILPVAETFRAMASKGFALPEMLSELNAKLRARLPTGIFFAACLAHYDLSGFLSLWNGGLPDGLILDAQGVVRLRLPSAHAPLGIIEGGPWDWQPEHIRVSPDDTLVIASDGLNEAESAAGEAFGTARIEAALAGVAEAGRLPALEAALAGFIGDNRPHDDICLALMPCRPQFLAEEAAEETPAVSCGQFSQRIELNGALLASFDPIQVLLAFVGESGLRNVRAALSTIATELYVNALDHGILGLDSALKSDAAGFAHYFAERARRLAQLVEGHVTLEIQCNICPSGGVATLTVEDSGPGFDHRARESRATEGYCGRGRALIESLCQSLRYHGRGNRVEAVYVWGEGGRG